MKMFCLKTISNAEKVKKSYSKQFFLIFKNILPAANNCWNEKNTKLKPHKVKSFNYFSRKTILVLIKR